MQLIVWRSELLQIVRLRLGRLQLADYLEVRDAAIREVKVREVDWM